MIKHTFLTAKGTVYIATAAKSTADTEIDARPAGEEQYYFNVPNMSWIKDGRSVPRKATPKRTPRAIPAECVVHSNAHTAATATGSPTGVERRANANSGFTWTIKEMLPLLITILAFLGSGVTVYNKLSSDLIVAQQEISHIKVEQSTVEAKLGEIAKSNEGIKLQLEDLRTSLMMMMRPEKQK